MLLFLPSTNFSKQFLIPSQTLQRVHPSRVDLLVVVALHVGPVVEVDPEPDREPPVSAVVPDDHGGDLAVGGREAQAFLGENRVLLDLMTFYK